MLAEVEEATVNINYNLKTSSRRRGDCSSSPFFRKTDPPESWCCLSQKLHEVNPSDETVGCPVPTFRTEVFILHTLDMLLAGSPEVESHLTPEADPFLGQPTSND